MASYLDLYTNTKPQDPDAIRKQLESLGAAVPTPPMQSQSTPAQTASPAPAVPQANVPAPELKQGNPYNEILYSKTQWEAPGSGQGTKTWAEQNASKYYDMLSPEEAAKVHNMNAAELSAYIPRPQQATTAQQQPMAQPQASVPMPTNPYTMTPDQIRAEAQARIDRQRAALAQSVNATKTVLKNTFDYNNQITNDRRTLENSAFNRNNSPFSGHTNYLASDLARTRQIADTASQKDYAAAVAAADQKLADFDANSPEQIDALVNELTRIERDYGLQVGSLTGNFNGQRTLAGQQFDWQKDPNNPNYQGQVLNNQGQAIQNQINQIKLSNLPTEIKQQADLFAQQYAKGDIDLQTAQFNLQQLSDPNSPLNVAKSLDNQLKQMELEYMPQENRLKLQQLQKQIDQIGKAPYRTPEEIDYDKQKVELIKAQIADIKSPNQPTQTQQNNQYSADIIGKVNQMTPENRKSFFANEKETIVSRIGTSGYNALYSQYFNTDGSPK